MSKDMVYENVPRVTKRVGDNVVAGANNTLIMLGRDRLGPVDSGYGHEGHGGGGIKAGAIHIVAGRKSPDPSIIDDSSTIYLSQRTDPDSAAGTTSVGSEKKDTSAIVSRSDCMRIVAREDFKLSVGKAFITIDKDGSITIEGDLSLGKGAQQRMIRADAFSDFWKTVVVPTAMGPSGPLPPIPPSVFTTRTKVA